MKLSSAKSNKQGEVQSLATKQMNMIDYMDPHNWDKEQVKEAKITIVCSCAIIAVMYVAMWVFY